MLLTRPYRNNYGASTGNGPTLSSAGQAHIDACPQSYGPQSCHYLRIIEMEREEDYNNFTGRLFVLYIVRGEMGPRLIVMAARYKTICG